MENRRRRGRQPLYRWDEWFRSGRFALRTGVDYRCATDQMTQQIRNQASARRLSVEVVPTARGLDVAVVGILAPDPAPCRT